MKQIKIAFWVIVFGFIALVVIQNIEFFKKTHILHVNLGFSQYQTWELHYGVLFLTFFFAGLFLTYIYSLFERFKSRKTIKELNNELQRRDQVLDSLKKEIESIKGDTVETAAPVEEEIEETKESQEQTAASS